MFYFALKVLKFFAIVFRKVETTVVLEKTLSCSNSSYFKEKEKMVRAKPGR